MSLDFDQGGGGGADGDASPALFVEETKGTDFPNSREPPPRPPRKRRPMSNVQWLLDQLHSSSLTEEEDEDEEADEDDNFDGDLERSSSLLSFIEEKGLPTNEPTRADS